MAKSGPIVVIEDDTDDLEILKEALRENYVPNEFLCFSNGPDAFQYLKTTSQQPFIILCDVNLPRQNGIEFKTQIDEDPILREKSIPFIFYSTYVSQYAVNEAYKNLTVQGFFQKNDTYEEFKNVVKTMIDYWGLCKHPNN
ncbi:MAG: response regulator [Ferruginibacter sp.]